MAKVKKIPERMCIGCQEMKKKTELVRIIRTPEGDIELDAVGKKPGRGAYLCFNSECLEKALKTKRIERSFKKPLSAEEIEMIREGWKQIVERKS